MPSILGTPTLSTGAAGSSHSFSHTLSAGSNRRQLILVQFDGTGLTAFEVSGVTFGGVAAARVTDGTTAAREQRIATNTTAAETWEVREANLPADGSQTVAVTMSGSVDGILVMAVTVQDADQSTNVSAVTTGNPPTNTSADLSITTTVDDSLVIDNLGVSATNWTNVTPGAGQTSIGVHSEGTASSQAASRKTVASAGTTSMTWTWTNNQTRRTHVVVALAPTAGGLTRQAGTLLTGTLVDA